MTNENFDIFTFSELGEHYHHCTCKCIGERIMTISSFHISPAVHNSQFVNPNTLDGEEPACGNESVVSITVLGYFRDLAK